MKKNLTFLTGIVFLITILVAGSCGNSEKQNSPPEEEEIPNDSPKVADAPTSVSIYLKDTLIDGRMHLEMTDDRHLEMYDDKDPKKKVIDTLTTVVYRGYTVTFMNADESNIKKVNHIRLVEVDSIFSGEVIEVEGRSLFKLEILPNAPYDTIVKYEIVFTVKDTTKETTKETTWCIDPYLKIPKEL